MAKSVGTVLIDVERCKGCELCAEICPDYCFEVYRSVKHVDAAAEAHA